jgi:hypothetical protein
MRVKWLKTNRGHFHIHDADRTIVDDVTRVVAKCHPWLYLPTASAALTLLATLLPKQLTPSSE